jgi:hypothetical protein
MFIEVQHKRILYPVRDPSTSLYVKGVELMNVVSI